MDSSKVAHIRDYVDSSKVAHIRNLAEHSMWDITGTDCGLDPYILIWGEIYSPSFMALPLYTLEDKMADFLETRLKEFKDETA